MNRNIQLKHKLYLSLSGASRLDEPFFFPLALEGALAFFFSESSSLELSGLFFWPGLSPRIGKSLTELTNPFYSNEVHHPQYGFFLNYLASPFYGKLSLSKNWVANFNISFSLGGGALSLVQDQVSGRGEELGDPQWAPAALIGIYQRIFIGKKFFVHGKISILSFYGPNPIWCEIHKDRQGPDACINYQRDIKSYSELEKIIMFRTLVGGGVGVLLF